ncbi:MAG: hypothetical protein QMC78_02510 [Methanocellales archaeon]|nr:hypothetical protein [Methanocellales archaeon]
MKIEAKSITLDIGDGYKLRGTRATIGTFDLVVIDWEHPNYGYFADAMLWIKSMHMKDWEPYIVARCFKEYKTLDDFLEDYPQLRELFDAADFAKDILKIALKDHNKYFVQ